MNKIETIRKQYQKDIDNISTKQRFGYFSIPPSYCSRQEIQKTKVIKDQNNRVITQERNIYSGTSAKGMGKKSYFSYIPSYTSGDIHQMKGKDQKNSKWKQQNKDTFKPLSLNKTIIKSAYPYMMQNPTSLNFKRYRDESNQVKIENPNIFTSLGSKIRKEAQKQYEYVADPYNNSKVQYRKQLYKSIAKRGQAPLKLGSSIKQDYFTSIRQQYGDENNLKKNNHSSNYILNVFEHDNKFKPSCRSNINMNGIFSKLQYICQTNNKQKKIQKNRNFVGQKQHFKIKTNKQNTKPSPSISLMNLMHYKNIR